MRILFASFVIIFFCLSANAQYVMPEKGEVFVDTEVPRIDIFISNDYLDLILHPDSLQSFTEYPAKFIFRTSEINDTMDNIGFRLRGNTSRTSAKKSFKVSFNSFEKGRDYKGLEKMNLNGEHNDPSITRSKMCWDLYNQAGVPSSRSNHVQLYINSEYKGLYINVEHVDEEFVEKRMSDGSGNLWKCLWPADLNYKGTNPLLYAEPEPWGRRAYQLQTNEEEWDYSKLAHFIDVLNNFQGEEFKCELERIFDVDNYLRVIVLDILCGNWDGPIVNKNNFYLYHNPCTDQITYIPYDLDNTLGIDWFGVDWQSSDIYDWSQYAGNESRPIYDRILAVDEWRDRYSQYMFEAIQSTFTPQILNQYLDEKLALIESHRVNDVYASYDYGYNYNDFVNSYQVGIGAHASIGLKPYILERYETAAFQMSLNPFPPFISEMDLVWSENEINFLLTPISGTQLSTATFHYSINGGNWQTENCTIVANEISYAFTVPQNGILIYYFEIEDTTGNVASYPRCQDATVKLGYDDVPNIVINEFLASNLNKQTDESGEAEDWIELYNPTNNNYELDGLFLSDDENEPNKWPLPDITMGPESYLMIWADNDEQQGPLHAGFKLKKTGEHIGLYDSKNNNYAPLDQVDYPEQETDVSYARSPNGTGDFAFAEWTTFGYNNDELSSSKELHKNEVILFPNPTSGLLRTQDGENWNLEIYDFSGKIITRNFGNEFEVSSFENGIYFAVLKNSKGDRFIQKLIVQK